MTEYTAPLTALFGRPPTADERAAAAAQGARLDEGIFANPLLAAASSLEEPVPGMALRRASLVDLPLFAVPAP